MHDAAFKVLMRKPFPILALLLLLALAPCLPALEEDPALPELLLADQLFDQQAYGLAASRYQAYLRSQPMGLAAARARLNLAQAYLDLARLDDAQRVDRDFL